MGTTSGEYLSSNALVAYPFSDDSEVPERVRRAFVDACVEWREGDPDAAVTLVSVIDGRLSVRVEMGGESLVLSESDAERSFGAWTVYRKDWACLVADSGFLSGATFSEEGRFPLSPSCHDPLPPAVRSISLMKYENGSDEPVVTESGISGDVVIESGTNMLVSDSESGVLLSAGAGFGEGVVPCTCPDPGATGEGAMVQPSPAGDVVIEGDGCINVSTNNSTAISIDGRCVPCCTSAKYQEQLDRLAGLNGSLASAHSRVMSTFREYDSSVSDFNAALEVPLPTEIGLSSTLSAPAKRDAASSWDNPNVKGSHLWVSLTAVASNKSQGTVTANIRPPSVIGAPVRNHGYVVSAPVTIGDDGNPLRRAIESYGPNDIAEVVLPPGSSAVVRATFTHAAPSAVSGTVTFISNVFAVFTYQGKSKVGEKTYQVVERVYTRSSEASITVER